MTDLELLEQAADALDEHGTHYVLVCAIRARLLTQGRSDEQLEERSSDIEQKPAGEIVEHISSIDCWCEPYQDTECENVWIHRDIKNEGH